MAFHDPGWVRREACATQGMTGRRDKGEHRKRGKSGSMAAWAWMLRHLTEIDKRMLKLMHLRHKNP